MKTLFLHTSLARYGSVDLIIPSKEGRSALPAYCAAGGQLIISLILEVEQSTSGPGDLHPDNLKEGVIA